LFTGGKAFAIRQPFNEDNSHIYYHSLTADHSSTCGVYFTSDCHSTGLNLDFGGRKAVGVGLGGRKVGSGRLYWVVTAQASAPGKVTVFSSMSDV
jgi:hypothetical protein